MPNTTTKRADELGLDDLFQRIDLTGFEKSPLEDRRYLGYVQMIEGPYDIPYANGTVRVITVSLVTGDDVTRVHVRPHIEVTVNRTEARTNIHFGGAS